MSEANNSELNLPRGFPEPKILVFRKVVETSFTGSFTVRGSNFSLGLLAADSSNNK